MNESIVRSKGNQNSYKKSKQGWIFVHLEGNSGTRGFDYGYLLADEIVNAISDAKKLIEIQTGVPWEFFVQNEASIIHTWKEHLNSDKYFTFYVELLGIADGVRKARPDSNISIDDIILWNGYEELTDYWFPTVASTIYQLMDGERSGGAHMQTHKHFCNGSADHCSAFIATGSYTEGGKIVMAHNCFTPFENGNYLNVIADIMPDHGHRFIMQTQPGYIHSMSDFYETKTGLDGGLMITETTIGGFTAYDPSGAPEFLKPLSRGNVRFGPYLPPLL